MPLTSRDDYVALLELTQAGKIDVREMITRRLMLAETGHLYLSLRGALPLLSLRAPERCVAISPGLSGLSESAYRAAEVARPAF